MKKLLTMIAAALVVLAAGCSKEFDDSALNNRIDNLESRVSALEALCKQMNTNISSLQTIVEALQNADYITSVTPVTQSGVTIGYAITFAKNGSITIYHGTDGKDGQNGKDGADGKNGADGKDGYTPVIGVRQDTDGLYYWTLDGEWLLDASGNKICAVGRDGRDGVDGQPGKDGADGQDGRNGVDGKDGVDGQPGKDGADGRNGVDGKDGITPQLKIEDGYWFISYDNGATWTQLGKATGEDGKDGTNGKDGADGKDGVDGQPGRDGVDGQPGQPGADGDSMFREVTQDELNVYLTLADGTVITIPKGAPLSIAFDEEDLVVMAPNSTREIHYTISSVISDVEIEVVSSADIKAKVVTATATTGAIEVKTGSTIDEYSKVVVFVSNGEKVIMRRFVFEEAKLEVTDNAKKELAQDGGTLTLEYMSNMECEVVISKEGQSWIKPVLTRAVERHSISFEIAPNNGMTRSATIELKGAGLSFIYTITQIGYDNPADVERAALIALYKSTNGDKWTNNTNWCSDKPLGEWYGVTADFEGNVLMLILTDNQLSGSIPSDIGNLSNLTRLDLSLNQLSGSIPSEIGNIINLTDLGLSYNRLSGSIPPEIGNLTNLQNLSLSNNFIGGTIPKQIQNLEVWRKDWFYILRNNAFDLSGTIIYAPEFSLKTLDGKVVGSFMYETNKYTILYQWVEWSPYCEMSTPLLVRLYEGYHNKGVDVIGWSMDEEQLALDYIDRHSIPWSNALVPYFWDAAPISANIFPAINVVDSNGYIVFNCATDDYRALPDFLNQHLGEGEPVTPDYESTDYSQDGKVVTLQKATKGNGIDIVLMGDAYSDRQIADGTYMKAMQTMADNLFSEEPYKSFKDMFNVYVVNVVSATEGYEYGNTALSGFFGGGTYVGGNDALCFQYALNAISEERMDEALIVVAMNQDAYAGTCFMYYPTTVTGTYGSGPSVAYFPTSSDTATLSGLVLHEAGGHGFSKLADEYDYGTTVSAEEVNATKAQQADWGWWKNVDFTGNPAEVRWNYFLSDYRYANDGLGVFEGGLTHSFGVWRPTDNSIMRYNYGGFNAPSREAIYYRIHKLAYGDSWQYNYEEFVKYDEINRKAAASARVYAPSTYKPTHPPVVVNKSWRDAK